MSIADSEKSDAMPVASLFKMLGWEVDATEGTAAYLNKWGIEANLVEVEEIVKRLRAGKWNLVLNIPSGSERHMADGAMIRKQACAAGIPCLHSIAAAWAVAAGLNRTER
ncbi:MAG: carbamoyl-phosphate synthase large subunit, partial [Synergistes sp.]|nr:carbamoyl-phosphate synthase large subunit [Synergistes sp.]